MERRNEGCIGGRMKTCKYCKYWGKRGALHRQCLNPKLNSYDIDGVVPHPSGPTPEGLWTAPFFGCIHWLNLETENQNP